MAHTVMYHMGIQTADIGFPGHPQRASGPGLLSGGNAHQTQNDEQTDQHRPRHVSFHGTSSLDSLWPSPHVRSQTFSPRHVNPKISSSETCLSLNARRALVTKAQQALSTDDLIALAASGTAAHY